jgi:formate/nitrite transporter FocA (FNT family)
LNRADISLSHSLSIIVNNKQQNFGKKTMKIKFMAMLAGVLMVAATIVPLSAQACSGEKNTSNSDSPREPSNLPQT